MQLTPPFYTVESGEGVFTQITIHPLSLAQYYGWGQLLHGYHYSSQTSITVLKLTPSGTTDEASYYNVSQLNTNATDFPLFLCQATVNHQKWELLVMLVCMGIYLVYTKYTADINLCAQ